MPEGLPLGWQAEDWDPKDKVKSVCNAFAHHYAGWIASIFAISLGAPFWFDLLNKIASLRSTGPKPSTSDPKAGS